MRIRDVRWKLNFTQQKMGELMGMPQSSIARIETGKNEETKQQIATLKLLLRLEKHEDLHRL